MFISYYVSCVICNVSHVTSHLAPVICHMSYVTSHLKKKTFFIIIKKENKTNIYIFFFIGQSYGASRLRVCYQWGLPRLILLPIDRENRINLWCLAPQVFQWILSYVCMIKLFNIFINRPGVARAILQSPLCIIHSFIHSSFCSESSRHCPSQAERAGRIFPPPCVTCNRSRFRCLV